MPATTTTVSGSIASQNDTNTSATLSNVKSLQKMATEREAKRIANVAIQTRKLEVAKKKAAEELLSKGKNAILKDKPSRPARRPAKKNRKPLPPPSNKEHDTQTATVATTVVVKTKEQLAALSNVRPSHNFDQIIEQRMVNGVVERITQPTISQPVSSKPISAENKFHPFHSYANIIEQRVVNRVTERIPESADAPQAVASDIDTDSDSVAESDNDAIGDISQLVFQPPTPEQSTDSSEDGIDAVETASATVLSHTCGNLPITDADDEASPPSSVNEAKKATKANRKTSVLGEGDAPDFVASLLSKPNGPGETKEARDLRNNLVKMHVAPSEFSHSFQQQKKTKEAVSADAIVPGPIHELVADDHVPAITELNPDDFRNDEKILIEDVFDFGPLPFIGVEGDLQKIDGQALDAINKQTAVIPDDTTPVTPPASDPDLLSSGSDYPKSTKTSRRSSIGSSAESVRRKAEKARTTFLGNTSLETFVNTLDFELCDGMTTKDDACEAFTYLADRPITGLDSVKMQRKIKLGGTSLYGFLCQLDCDDEGFTVVGKVMAVFNKAAKHESSSSKLDVALWLAESS